MEKVLPLLTDYIDGDTMDQLMFGEVGGRGSRVAARFEDFGQSI